MLRSMPLVVRSISKKLMKRFTIGIVAVSAMTSASLVNAQSPDPFQLTQLPQIQTPNVPNVKSPFVPPMPLPPPNSPTEIKPPAKPETNSKPELKQDSKPEFKPQETKPETNPVVPPMPTAPVPQMLPLEMPTMPAVSACESCGSSGCTDPGCGGKPIVVGPKYPVELDFTQHLLWFQPKTSRFPIATSGGNVLLDGKEQLGMYLAPGLNLKMWLDKEHLFGIGGGLFISENRSSFQSVSGGPGGLIIERPFTDVLTGAQSSLFVSNSNFAGSIATANKARLAGGEIHFTRNIYNDPKSRIDLFAGFRYYDLNESFTIYQSTDIVTGGTISVGGQPPLAAGTKIILQDRAYTRNQFYGGEVGSFMKHSHGILFATLTPRLAFGTFHQVTNITGSTRSTDQTQQPVNGGLLAVGTGPNDGNILRSSENRFGLAANVAINGGVNLTEHFSVAVGYTFMFFNEVARPLGQFDQNINQRLVPTNSTFGTTSGPASPLNRGFRESFYAHGANIVFQIAY